MTGLRVIKGADARTSAPRTMGRATSIPEFIVKRVSIDLAERLGDNRDRLGFAQRGLTGVRAAGDDDVMNQTDNLLGTQLESQLRFEVLLTDLSARFVNVPDGEVDVAIEEAQSQLCRILEVDRCTLWQPSASAPDTLVLTHLHQAPGEPPIPERPDARDLFPWVLQKVQCGEVVVVTRLSDLPPEAARDRECMLRYRAKSTLVFPLATGGGPVFGALTFDATRQEREWQGPLVKRLQLIALVFANVLARKRAQQQVRKVAEEWRTTFDAIQDSLMILDPGFRILQANAATASFLGLPLDRIPGQLCHTLFHGTAGCVEGCPSAKAVQTRRHEESDLFLEGKQVWLLVSADPIQDAAGNLVGVVHIARDITASRRSETERQQLRERLAHAGRVSVLGQLTSALAHELNQPLGAILSNADAAELFLQQDPPALDEVRAILADIRKDDRRAGEVIQRMRRLLKRRELELTALAVNGLVNEAVTLLRSEASSRKVMVEIELAPDLPPIIGDRVHLEQVLLNLIVNGMDAVAANPPEARRLVVRAQRSGPRSVAVEVSDCGHGIPADKLARFFEPFHSTKPGGLGLGLAISRTLVEAHGGQLQAENNPERGATVRFTLPVTKAQASQEG